MVAKCFIGTSKLKINNDLSAAKWYSLQASQIQSLKEKKKRSKERELFTGLCHKLKAITLAGEAIIIPRMDL